MCVNNSNFICSIRKVNNHSFAILIISYVCNHTHIKRILYGIIVHIFSERL